MFAALTLPKTTVRELRSYFAAAARLYGVLPLRKLLEIYNSQNPAISQEDFLAVAEVIRHEKNHYAILGQENRMRHVAPSRPMDREVVADYCYTMGWEEYDELIESQQGKSYYIPEKQELLRYADDAYYEASPEQEAMRRYLRSKAKRDMAEEMLLEIQNGFYNDCSLKIVKDHLERMGLRFVSEADVRRFSDLAVRLGNSVRRPSLRGLNPKEASHSYPRVFMPRQERSQFPLRPIKVGRNEPCPCGSGKKYKRCCGQ
jgi:preprotein translocase subunit SecA